MHRGNQSHAEKNDIVSTLHTCYPDKDIVRLIIDCVALTKQGDNAHGSVRLSVCLFACALLFELFDLRP